MKAKNQLVVLSGILVLLVTATISAANYVAQPVKAQGQSGTPYGNSISGYAQSLSPNFGSVVSSAAKDPTSLGHIGLGDSRANGCKFGATSPPPTGNGSPPICPP